MNSYKNVEQLIQQNVKNKSKPTMDQAGLNPKFQRKYNRKIY